MWEIHNNVTIFITFKTCNVWAMSGYVAMFLALEKSSSFVSIADHRWWSDGGSQL